MNEMSETPESYENENVCDNCQCDRFQVCDCRCHGDNCFVGPQTNFTRESVLTKEMEA